ncbi:hypothetical protein F5Y12DRAFT_739178 [Xylaria sp. FL1777]|nr:hypothetical protein F5Y12DRAFT_739178 [Xylaria sp. FL1777]
MDPLSITLASVTLIDVITKVCKNGTSFLIDVRNAKSDIETIIGEFDSIKAIITLIASEFQQQSVEHVPTPLHEKIVGIINNCVDLIVDIDKSLTGYGSTPAQKRLKWAASGKKDIAKARGGLSAHRVALELALEMLNMQVVKEIRDGTIELTSDTRETKEQTSRILEGNRNIRDDVQRILQEISRLQALLPSERPNSVMLQRYLDELSSYVESVRDGSDLVKSNNDPQVVSEERQMEEPRSESQEQENSRTSLTSDDQISPKSSIFQHNKTSIQCVSTSEAGKWPFRFTDKQDEDPTPAQVSFLQVLDAEDDGTAREFRFTKEEDILIPTAQLLEIIPRFRYISVGRPHVGNSNGVPLKVSSYLRSIYQIPQSFFELSVSPQSSWGSLNTGISRSKPEGFPETWATKTSKQYRLWYILRTIKKCASLPKFMWTVESVAVYHSFDVDTFSSFWLAIHDTDETKYGAYEAFSAAQQNPDAVSCRPVLTSALETQLLFLKLTEDNWESYIADLEDTFSRTIKQVKATAIHENIPRHPLDTDADTTIWNDKGQDMIQNFNDSMQGVPSMLQNSQKPDRSLRRRRVHPMKIGEVHEETTRQVGSEIESYLREDAVNMHEKQELHRLESQVQDALLNLQLNLTVLRETKSHYQKMQDHMLPPGPIRDQAQIEMKEFLYNAGQIETNLAIKHRKLETLDRHVQVRISLCDGILQYHSLRVSKMFNEQAVSSSRSIERIAIRTEQDTRFLRIITATTLIFLPFTFVASFLSSNIPLLPPSTLFELDLYYWFSFIRPLSRTCVIFSFLMNIIWVTQFWLSSRRKASEIEKLRGEEAWKLV